MAADPYRYFRLEARELLDQFGKEILELERSVQPAEQVRRLLRLAHTLKGAARVVKQREIAEHAHAIEEELASLRDTAGEVPRKPVDTVLKYLDEIQDRVLALTPAERVSTTASAAASDDGFRDDGLRAVRADLGEMDAVLDGASETLAVLGGLRRTARRLEQARHLTDLLADQFAPRRAAGDARHSAAAAERAYSMAEELRKDFGGLERAVGASIDQMDRELRQLRDTAEQLRLVSASTLFTSLERTARDAAQAMGKRVNFEGTGGDIRLDAHVLSVLQGALVQLVRNAVAHGIEVETQRRTAGKTAAGQVTIAVSRRGRRIAFACRDDGRGLDLEAVRGAAARRGAPDLESEHVNAQALNAEDLVRLLLRGGISTSAAVTELSGRGIGLDVVREALARLGGEVAVSTETGQGTTFELVVPLSLASLEVLVVQAGSTVSIPLEAVRGSMRLASNEISGTSSGATVLHQQKAIPFILMQQALRGSPLAGGRACSAVVVAGAGGLAAVGVDRLHGTARIVMRPLPELASAASVVAGASLNAEGDPQLVLDPDALVAEALRSDTAGLEPAASPRPVLVVDDSLTSRMLEQGILESAGYEVDTAISGEQALESARRKRYALFLVDVEMPGIDGFTFVERTRADPSLRDIPSILITSRAAPEDLRRGHEVGARGYIVKSAFDQAELLSMIRPLMS